jgi:hypothetical protein
MQKHLASLIVVLALLVPLQSWAKGPFQMHGLQPGKMTMQGHYDEVKTTATYTVTKETHAGKPCYRAIWSTSVKKIDMLFWPDGQPIRSRYEKPGKKTVVEIEYTPSGAKYKYTENGETTKTTVKQKGLIESLALDLLLMAYPFEKGTEVIFYGIDADSDDGDEYEMYAELEKVETIKVLGKNVKAYKIEMSLKGFTGLFAPTFYFWYSFDKPHRYLKYSGPDEEFVLTGGGLAL